MPEYKCKFPECDEQALPGSHFCSVHYLQREVYRRAKRIRPSGTITSGLRGAALHLLNPRTPLGRVVGLYAQNLVGDINATIIQNMGGSDAPVNPDIKEPVEEVYEDFDYADDAETEQFVPDKKLELKKAWELLGLDAFNSTEDDVRKRQRQFAEILHSDKGNAQVAEERLKEINAAASLCIASIKDIKDV